MDPLPQTTTSTPPPSAPPPVTPSPIQPNPGGKSKLPFSLVILIGAGVLVLILVLVFVFRKQLTKSASRTGISNPGASQNTPGGNGAAGSKQKKSTAFIQPLPYLVGAWFTNESRIYLVDPQTQNKSAIASLPFTIKKIHPLSQTKLLYINNTNVHDQGTDISVWDTGTQAPTKVIPADPGYLVDDYAISPNGRYLVDWELQLNPQANTVKGGKARMYAVDLASPSAKTLIFDESANGNLIHYPILVTDSKEVFFDNYLPNSGAGYAYGITETSFDGTQKRDLPDMQNGTYSMQPLLTSDNKYLVFSAYDETKGKGTDLDGKTRVAINNPNAINLYDIATKKRRILTNVPKGKLFRNLQTSAADPDTFYFQVSATDTTLENAVYSYNISTQTITHMSVPTSSLKHPIIVSALSDNTLLMGDLTTDQSIAGNLGFYYHVPYTALVQWNVDTNTMTPMPLGEVSLAQYIDTIAASKKSVLAAKCDKDSLELCTLPYITPTPIPTATPVPAAPPVIKQNLQDERTGQQSDPSNRLTEHDSKEDREGDGELHESHDPLYLYGSAGTSLTVTVNGQTPYHMTNGIFSYDSVPAFMPQQPLYGSIASQDALSDTLMWYAANLGLNTQETADLLSYAKGHLNSPYTFVSFFDENTSEKIFPLTFTPLPTSHRAIVFYFADKTALPGVPPRAPVFPHVSLRTGLTAIQIGEIHE